jgi:glycine oxidase
MSAQVLVVGDGIIGLCVANALARRGVESRVFRANRVGTASRAAAGLVAPSFGHTPPAALPFLVACRDAYPAFASWLSAESGMPIPINRNGLLEVALDADEAALLRATDAGTFLDPASLATVEPSLSHAAGALLHPLDGGVDNVRVMEALELVTRRSDRIQVVNAAVERLDFTATRTRTGRGGAGIAVTSEGAEFEGTAIVLAAGAWCAQIGGLPRPLPIFPLRGQMLAVATSPLSHAVRGRSVYLAPRPDRTLIGATEEDVGFDPRTTPDALAHLHAEAIRLCPALDAQPVVHEWAGLRPATPDLLPILGPDPDVAALLYACGHSKNGILMAPLTAECIADWVDGSELRHDLAAFSVRRFTA